MRFRINKGSPFLLILSLYIISIEAFSYRAGFVLVSYGLCVLMLLYFANATHLQIQNSILLKYMTVLTIVFFISVFFSAYPKNSFTRFITMGLMLLVCVSIENGLEPMASEEVFDYFSKTIIIACIFGFFVDLILVGPSKYLSFILSGNRLTGSASQTNVMGVFGAMTANIMAYHLIFNKNKKMLVYLVFPLLMILASQSKKAILCVVLGVLILVAVKYRNKKAIGLLLLFLMGVIIFYISSLPFFSPIMQRFTTALDTVLGTSNQVSDWSTYYRVKLIEEGIEFFKQKPILGHGTDCFYLISQYQAYSHNNYIELLACNGIVGFVAYYWVHLYMIYQILRLMIIHKDSRSGLLLCLVLTTLLLDYGQVSYYDKMTYVYLSWILIYIRKAKMELRSI